jgi:hypothetical protein
LIHCLGRRQLVADRTNSAQTLNEERHFPVGTPLNEFLKTAEFDDVETRFMDMIIRIEHQRDLAVPLDARDRIDGDASQAGSGIFVLLHGGLSLIVVYELFRQRRFPAFQQVAEYAEKLVGGRRAPRQVIIDVHYLVQRMHFVEQ